MRRYLPDALKKNPEPPTASASGEFVLDLRIPLQCITPVFGGGVETRIPDQVEALRIPGLRGGLRALWRAVTDYGEDDLFRREAALFGGVSLGVLRGPDALRSRLVLSVTVDDSGKCEAAGVHLKGPRGDFKALPQWDRRLGQDLGYALFPLQLKEADRKAADRKQPSLATHELRYGLRFTLRVRLRARSGLPGGAPDAQVIEELLWALCALVHFGGVGARQSRGFGALSLQEDQIVTGLDALEATWQPRFAPPDRDRLNNWLLGLGMALGTAADEARPPPWASLRHARLYLGPAARSADDAHALLVGLLRQFRQGVGMGREEGRTKREGVSRWPEGQVLRALREADAPGIPWEHPPDPAMVQIAKRQPELLSMPRAAFGLPIVFGFIDRMDKEASSTLNADSQRGDRFASPLRLRPLRCQKGFASLVILYPNRPTGVCVVMNARGAQRKEISLGIKRRHPPATRAAVATWLDRADGDAAAAFVLYLQGQRFIEATRRGR